MSLIGAIERTVDAVKCVVQIPGWISLAKEVIHNRKNRYYRAHFYEGNFRDLLEKKKVDWSIFFGIAQAIGIVVFLKFTYENFGKGFKLLGWLCLIALFICVVCFLLNCQTFFDQLGIANEVAYHAALRDMEMAKKNRRAARQRQASGTPAPRQQPPAQPRQSGQSRQPTAQRSGTARSGPVAPFARGPMPPGGHSGMGPHGGPCGHPGHHGGSCGHAGHGGPGGCPGGHGGHGGHGGY